MRSAFLVALSVLMMIIFIPMVLINGCRGPVLEEKKEKEIVVGQRLVKVYISEKDRVETIELEEYIKGVVSGEMPGSFHMEALKAQAVAARSYAISRINAYKEGGHPNHPEAELCDTVHCQVYISKEKLEEIKSKKWMEEYWPRIEEAVDGTQGLIMTYNSKPVDQPLFHSTSGGKTENSEDVFVSSVPYLRSVDSPYEEKAPYFKDLQEVPINTFVSKIKAKYKDCTIKASNIKSSVKIIERSEGGRILKIQVGNKTLTGREIRDLFALRSANFKIAVNGNNLGFETVGYGHGVGMSQWGANGMAEQGYTFDAILKHYYVGVEVNPVP